ncbi:MAG: acyltransferase [Proteobacteria bacterium]|nr:acyltransferase [Pseudomonadota bacterium]
MNLSDIAVGRDNNFNLLRIIAAYGVLITHSFAIAIGTGEAEPKLHGFSLGALAVHIFFVTSGFLVTASLIRRKSFIEFVWARFLRIFPALFVMLLLTVFGLGLVFTTLTTSQYLSDSQTYYYFAKCISLFLGVAHQLPGVFNDNPLEGAVNGSLWTLPHEVRLYVMLAFAWAALKLFPSRQNGFFKIFIVFVFVATGLYLLSSIVLDEKQQNTFLLMFMFFSGSLFYIMKERIRISGNIALLVFALLLVSMFDERAFKTVYFFSLPYLIFYLAYVPSGFIRKYNALGDYSYGVYIYAFPVQQTVAALVPDVSVGMMVIYSSIGTFFLSILSWHLIEERSLTLKDSSVSFTRKVYSKIPVPVRTKSKN